VGCEANHDAPRSARDAEAAADSDAASSELETVDAAAQNPQEVGLDAAGGFSALGPYAVVRDQPVGEGFELPIADSDTAAGAATCAGLAGIFGTDAAEVLSLPPELEMDLYSLYRPAQLEEGRRYPLLSWGNGPCAKPETYGVLLRHLASHGFFVVAANSRQVATNAGVVRAIDWAFHANADPSSPYFQRIDTERVGAWGHSDGAGAVSLASVDPRIKSVLMFSNVFANELPVRPFLTVTGDRDLVGNLTALHAAVQASKVPAAYLWLHQVPGSGRFDGHLIAVSLPERVAGPAAAWFAMTLRQQPEGRAWFVGESCELCTRAGESDFGQHGL
jgi:Chlorophyllase enzyme